MTTAEISATMSQAQQYTSPFTKWPQYVELENQPKGGSTWWLKADKLADLSTAKKIRAVVKGVDHHMLTGTKLRRKPHILGQLKAYLKLSKHELGFEYSQRFQAAKEVVRELSSKIRCCTVNISEWSEQGEGILQKINETATALAEMREEIQARLTEMKAQALSSDWRTELEKLGAWEMALADGKDKGAALLKQWEKEGHIQPGVDLQACLKWRGMVEGLEATERRLIFLAHDLHKVACAADAVESHKNDSDFAKMTTEELHEDMQQDLDEAVKMLSLLSLLGGENSRGSSLASLMGEELFSLGRRPS